MKDSETDRPIMHDLGTRSGPVLAFGGPYGNLQATRALRDEAERLCIPADHILCTGDLAAYGGEPEATAQLIREWGVAVIQGNVEQALATAAEGCGCGYEADTACAALSESWYPFCVAATSEETKLWMGRLPERLSLRVGPFRVSVIHGGVSTVNRFLFASTPISEKGAEAAACGADLVIAGHSGLPFTQDLGPWNGRTPIWHNAGVIGLPANDGTPEVWYSLIEVIDDGLVIHHRRLAYDHSAAARAMRHHGLPEGYAVALETGLWPSCDILPAAERANRGRRIEPVALRFVARREANVSAPTI